MAARIEEVTDLCGEAMVYLQTAEYSMAEETYASALELAEKE
jgi:hypothetical protein